MAGIRRHIDRMHVSHERFIRRIVTFFVLSVTSVSLIGRMIAPAAASPSANRLLNYQVRLTDAAGVPVADGTKNIKISFYDAASGGSRIATDCGTTGTPVARKVVFSNGTGTVLIGDTGADGSHNCADASAPNAIASTLFNADLVFLGITVESDAEMTPRKRIVATAYSLNADRLDDLETSDVGGANAFVPVTDSSGNLTLTQNLTVDTNTLFVDSANNRLGLGVTDVRERLTLADGSSLLIDSGNVISPNGGIGRAENRLTYSEQLDHANWTKVGTTIGSNAILGPDGGTISADQLNAGGVATDHVRQRSAASAATATFTGSIWMRVLASSNTVNIRIDARDCGTDALVSSGTNRTVTVLPTWQRFNVTQAFGAIAASCATFVIENGTVGTVRAWGAQLEQAATTSAYAYTEATAYGGPTYGLVVAGLGPHLISKGKLGIGVSGTGAFTPTAHVTVFKDSSALSNAAITSYGVGVSATSGSSDGIYMGDFGTAGTGYVALQSFNKPLSINPAGNNVGIGDASPAALLTVGSGDKFKVNADGDVTSSFTSLDGTDLANGTGSNSTTLVLDDTTGFNAGNYVLVNSTYAKIVSVDSGTNLTISPALTWADNATVDEYHVPEIGGVDLTQALANRYGRGYFIDGVVTGNGSTRFTDNLIETSGSTLNINSTGTVLINGGSGSTGCTIDSSGNFACTGTVSGGGSGDFANGGNSFAAAAILGTNDANSLSFETNNVTYLTIASGGGFTLPVDTDWTLTGGVNGLSFDGTTFSVDATNNRIGIGTNAPNAPLHIVSAVAPDIRIEETAASAGAQIFYQNTVRTWDMGSDASPDGFYLQPSSGAFGQGTFFVDPNGNVAFGNTSPDVHLMVGVSTSTADELIKVIGQADAGLQIIADNDNVTETDNAYVKFTQDGAIRNAFVGLVGNSGTDPQNSSYTGTLANALLLGNVDASTDVQIGTDAAVRMTIATGGNVGIGDTSPAAMLTVGSGDLFQVTSAGNVSSTGTFTFGDAAGDTVTSNAGAWTFANDTTVALSGGVNGINFDSNTLSIDATNNRLGVLTAAPDAVIDISNVGASDTVALMNFSEDDTLSFYLESGFSGTGGTGNSLKLETFTGANPMIWRADGVSTLGTISGSDPASPSNGMIYYNTTSNKFRCYQASAWTDCVGSGGGMSIGGTVTSGTTGSVLFVGASSALTQDNANFFWDDTNNRLGLGDATPEYALDIAVTGASTIAARLAKSAMPTAYGTPYLTLGGAEWIANGLTTLGFGYRTLAADKPPVEIGYLMTNTGGSTYGELVFATRNDSSAATAASERMRITSSGDLLLGTTTAGSRVMFQGTGTTSSTSSLNVRNSSGASLLYVRDDLRLGVGTTSPSAAFDLKGSFTNVGGATFGNQAAPAAPSVSPQGTPGSTTWAYKVTAVNHYGQETTASTAGSTSSGTSSLNGTDFNRITWSAIVGANQYKVYRSTAGGTPNSLGVIATVLSTATLQFDDTGFSATGTEPARNAYGDVAIGGNYSVSPAKLNVIEPGGTGLVDTLWLTGGAGTTNSGPNMVFNDYYGSGAYPTWRLAEIGAVYPSGSYNGDLIFKTNTGSGPTDSTEKMRLQYDGSLGIGDASPAATLTVGSGDKFQVAGASGNILTAGSLTTGDGVTVNDASGTALLVDTNSLVVDATNNRVGMGTASPEHRLDISDTAAFPAALKVSKSTIPTAFGSPYITIGGTEFSASGIQTIGFGYRSVAANMAPAEIGYAETTTSAETKGDLVFATRDVTTNTAPTERMRITSAGFVGIGDTSPAALLTVGSGDLFQVDGSGNVTASGDVAVNGADLTTTAATGNLFNTNATTVNVGGASGTGDGERCAVGRVIGDVLWRPRATLRHRGRDGQHPQHHFGVRHRHGQGHQHRSRQREREQFGILAHDGRDHGFRHRRGLGEVPHRCVRRGVLRQGVHGRRRVDEIL